MDDTKTLTQPDGEPPLTDKDRIQIANNLLRAGLLFTQAAWLVLNGDDRMASTMAESGVRFVNEVNGNLVALVTNEAILHGPQPGGSDRLS